ncbi:hypothetical protein E4U10_003290 [Claviceps purpurea]|nr:hypothetical protein E4U10_003290 [Claviceps purpurea]
MTTLTFDSSSVQQAADLTSLIFIHVDIEWHVKSHCRLQHGKVALCIFDSSINTSVYCSTRDPALDRKQPHRRLSKADFSAPAATYAVIMRMLHR